MQLDLIERVKAYETAHNNDDIETAMGMFAEDAEAVFIGLGTMSDLEAIRSIHGYDKGIQARLNFHDCVSDGLTVTCKATERNNWLRAAGINEISYTSSIFTFTETGQIKKIVATMSPESGEAMSAVLTEFTAWVKTNRPQESSPLFTSEGQFIYSESNGELIVRLLHEWRSEG